MRTASHSLAISILLLGFILLFTACNPEVKKEPETALTPRGENAKPVADAQMGKKVDLAHRGTSADWEKRYAFPDAGKITASA